MYQSTKVFELGSVCFRQWRATSHCRHIHGYDLRAKIWFETETLDERNWVVDFGGFKILKQDFKDGFDHKLIVAQDDPQIDKILELDSLGVVNARVHKQVSLEVFAETVYNLTRLWLLDSEDRPDVRVAKVEIWEHDRNSAIYIPGDIT